MRVFHFDSGREWRGGQAQVLLLMSELERLGAESLLAAPRAPLLERARAAGFSVHEWPSRGDWDLWAAGRAYRLLARERPDVVHVHSARAHALAVPAARRAGAGAVIVSRRVAVAPGRDPWSRWKYRLPVDRYLCVSEAARAALLAAGVPAARALVVPSGIPVARWREQAAAPGEDLRIRLGLAPDTAILGTVASLTGEKNHAMLLRVAGMLRDVEPRVHLVWIGEGPRRDALERERDRMELRDRVHVLGLREDVPALTRQFTLALVASRHEGFCTAAVEAMALGVPVIATAVGGIPEVVPATAGALVPADDAPAMAARARELIANPAERAARSAAARRAAEGFDSERTARGTYAAYRQVLAPGNGSVAPA